MENSITGLTPSPPILAKLWKILKNINYFGLKKWPSIEINFFFFNMEFDIAGSQQVVIQYCQAYSTHSHRKFLVTL